MVHEKRAPLMGSFSFILYGQPATKKNSAIMARGRSMLLPSKAYKAYESVCRKQLSEIKNKVQMPHFDTGVWIEAKYYLKDMAHYPDLVGLMQATADIISDEMKTVAGKRQVTRVWILSDDRIIKKWDGTRIAAIDKENPRVEVTITELPLDPAGETDPQIIKLIKERTQGNLL